MNHFENYLKSEGYLKKRASWVKEKPDSLIFIKIRNSHFSDKVIIDLGIYFFINEEGKNKYDILSCQLESRVEKIIASSVTWTKDDLCIFSNELENVFETMILPELNIVSSLDYLRTNFPDNFNHDRWWLANIREIDFIAYLNKY